MIGQAFAWWIVVQLMSLVALPITLTAFANLPGRGYAFAKPLALLLTGYLFWLALSTHVLPNRPGSVAWALIFVAFISVLVFLRRKEQLIEDVKQNLAFIAAVELVFFVTFFTAGHLKSFIPEIAGTEKPMDFMLLNAASRSRFYPPDDAWLAGFHVSYYYFGYVIQSMVAKLAFISTPVAFNLGLASTAALAATAAFGLAYELVRIVKGVSFRAALLVGVAALVFVTLLGNLEGAIEFGIANDSSLSKSLINRIDIANLDTAQASKTCVVSLPALCVDYPNEQSSHWWWWRATRISSDANSITEFPFFSFLLGDLHPHVMAIPFVFTVIALGLAFYRSGEALSGGLWRRRPALLLLSAVMLGGLGFLNTWDLPAFAFLLALLVVLRNRSLGRDVLVPWNLMRFVADKLKLTNASKDQSLRDVLTGTWTFLLPLAVLAFVFYAPFYFSFHTQADGFEAVRNGATRPLHSFLFWAPLLSISLPLPLVLLARDSAALDRRRLLYAGTLPACLLVLWAAVIVFGGHSLSSAVTARGWNWLTTLFLMSGLITCILALWRSLENDTTAAKSPVPATAPGRQQPVSTSRSPRFPLEPETAAQESPSLISDAALAPILAMMATALLLILGGELFYVRDVFSSRLNTVFKLSYQAWLLLGVSGAFSLFWLIERWQPKHARSSMLRNAWAASATLLLAAAMLYPLGATLSRTEGLAKTGRTLDGLAFARQQVPEDWAALDWLLKKVDRGERLVEATGGQYSDAGRIAAWSGVPTVIGWAGHEVQWGRGNADLGSRQQDVDRAYSTDSLVEALDILQKYDVTYVVVGSVERAKYPPAGLAKFADLPAPFNSGNTFIYRVPFESRDGAVAP